MNNSIYTDKQLVALAKKEYEPYDIGDWFFIDGGKPISKKWITRLGENLQLEN